jgi:hypothetical protein
MAIFVEEASPVNQLSPFKHPRRHGLKSCSPRDGPPVHNLPAQSPDILFGQLSLASSEESFQQRSTWGCSSPEAALQSSTGESIVNGRLLHNPYNNAGFFASPGHLPDPAAGLGAVRQEVREEEVHLTLRRGSVLPLLSPQAGASDRFEVDPYPDWNLGDLTAELDRFVHKNGTTPSPLRGGRGEWGQRRRRRWGVLCCKKSVGGFLSNATHTWLKSQDERDWMRRSERKAKHRFGHFSFPLVYSTFLLSCSPSQQTLSTAEWDADDCSLSWNFSIVRDFA